MGNLNKNPVTKQKIKIISDKEFEKFEKIKNWFV
jgi:hypothetical protein